MRLLGSDRLMPNFKDKTQIVYLYLIEDGDGITPAKLANVVC